MDARLHLSNRRSWARIWPGNWHSSLRVLVVFCLRHCGFNAPKLGLEGSLITDNIHLGLDLKGGTHLVLEVHVAEAVGFGDGPGCGAA